MDNGITNGAEAATVSALNCIDLSLSSSDIHQSVSLLKQVHHKVSCFFFPKCSLIKESSTQVIQINQIPGLGVFGLRFLLRG